MGMETTYDQQYAFAYYEGHGFSDGDPIEVRGNSNSNFNGFFVVHTLNDVNNFAYYVGEQSVSPTYIDYDAEVRSFYTYTFQGVFYAGLGDYDVVQDALSGNPMSLSMQHYQDVIYSASILPPPRA
jgi:hypothetical protein